MRLIPGRRDALARFAADGYRLLAVSWRPTFVEETHALLDLDVEAVSCPHPPGPPVCWCRKPLPGLGALLVARHGLGPARCILFAGSPPTAGSRTAWGSR